MDVQTISITLAGIGVFIAALNSIISSREARHDRQTDIQTRQAELLMELYRESRSAPFRSALVRLEHHMQWDNWDDYRQKYGPKTNVSEFVNTHLRLAIFFDGIGVLVEQGLIDINLVDTLLHNQIKFWWETMGPYYLEARQQTPHSEKRGYYPALDSAEHLYNLIEQKGQNRLQASASK
jgi:hypothetical protein